MNTYTIQKNLVGRYRILVETDDGTSVRGPYATEEQAMEDVSKMKKVDEENQKFTTWVDVRKL